MRSIAIAFAAFTFAAAAPMLVAAVPAKPDLAMGQQVFKAQCGICHATVAGKNGLGPSLLGVYGRAAGTAPGYNYSPAMKASKVKWDAKSLDAFIANPRKTVAGTKMIFIGQADPAKRAAIVAYLATLK